MSRTVLTTICLLCLIVAVLSAAVPQKMSYQAILTDSEGAPVTSTTQVIFTIWDAESAGTALWAETLSVSPSAQGGFSQILGEVNPITETVLSGATARYMGVQVGSDPEMSSRSELVSNAYSMRVATVDGSKAGALSGPLSLEAGDEPASLQIAGTGSQIVLISPASGDLFKATNIAGEDAVAIGLGLDGGGQVSVFAPSKSGLAAVLKWQLSAESGLVGENMRITPGGAIQAAGLNIVTQSTISRKSGQAVCAGPNLPADPDDAASQGVSMIGQGNDLTGATNSLAIGGCNTLVGDGGTAIGTDHVILFDGGFAVGAGNTIGTLSPGEESPRSVAFGTGNIIKAPDCVAMGAGNWIGAQRSFALGFDNYLDGGGENFVVGENNTNSASGNSSITGGEHHLLISSSNSVIGGGQGDTLRRAEYSVISGGANNIIDGSFYGDTAGCCDKITDATIGGGRNNKAYHISTTVGGGYSNIASGNGATVPGGQFNKAEGGWSFAAGYRSQALHDGGFVWSDLTGGDFASTAENQFLINATGGVGINTNSPSEALTVAGTIYSTTGGFKFPDMTTQLTAGGASNGLPLAGGTMTGPILSTGDPSITMGKGNFGSGNSNTGTNAFVAGENNIASGDSSAVGGGGGNVAEGATSVVSGGQGNTITFDNEVFSGGCVIAGGTGNSMTQASSGTMKYATIGGGSDNSIAISGTSQSVVGANIGGGRFNSIESGSRHATISGGYSNTVYNGHECAITGGNSNRITGAFSSVISGGLQDTVTGSYSVIPGGWRNRVTGKYSFAAGKNAKADHDGVFVWADSSSADYASTGPGQFLVRASGGVGLGIDTAYSQLTVEGDITSGTDDSYDLGTATYRWQDVYATNGTIQTSDRRLKKNINDLKYGLNEVLELRPVSYSWKKDESNEAQIGFVAQEVQSVISEVVNVGDDPNQTLGLHYDKLVPVLVNAIKEQQKQIEQLKAMLETILAEQKNPKTGSTKLAGIK